MIKRFPTPVLKQNWPFFVAGAITYWGVSKITTASENSDEWINDPRNPRFAKGGKIVDLNKDKAHE
ncbi:F1F0 ATP synthase subunit i NDAI_0D03250 [Naumovozyma dairenensis CBS 421]|uniref:ATP synthase subunit J, mitochondrial n=1 Tax=Naumovozyma dairenensis (strain ATCC 10597 / BCRC 20456 / CBS 421 / NBRC 0211 / NRRL Y-12639) TaxID=1071378 RepID=G0WA28_NAUDC|nr:hypothetical protein NDAI_0D03250 [Naumovozyma dairenensis CBS 421]CCD24639.1 hypothetical protein NDAI_0D03250 [Naumovozyma dairenensis CBS 421]